MNREMLKEAIAEAKTIKETAIANAKAALEEAFTPQLTAMFAEKLNEMEGMEEEVSKEMTDENYSVDEDFNLEEILAELDEVSKEDEIKESSENMEELMLEEMSDEELEGLILKVLRQEIEAGNVEAGENFEEEETDMEDMEDMGDMEDMEDMEGEEEVEDTEEVELEELLAEIEEMEKEKEPLKEYVDDYITPLQALLAIGGPVAAVVGSFLYYKFKDKAKDVVAKAEAGDAAAKAELEKAKAEAEKAIPTIKEADATEMEETIAELRSELNEVNLLNAKLLYTNKIFKAKNLTESEKVKVLNTFDKAETVKEVKLVFETLTESLKASSIAKKNTIKESLGSASKTISAPVETKQPIIEVNDAFARMRILAGLK
jgi:hypothetical protein